MSWHNTVVHHARCLFPINWHHMLLIAWHLNPLYPITAHALLTPWTSATRVTYCFSQKMMPFFPIKKKPNQTKQKQKKNPGQTWSMLSNFMQGKEESLSCIVPNSLSEHTNLAKKKQGLQEYENTRTWSTYYMTSVRYLVPGVDWVKTDIWLSPRPVPPVPVGP